MLYIDPEICIDCGGCVPVCPVEAIYDEVIIPDDKRDWIEKNKTLAAEHPVITQKIGPLDTAEGKRTQLGFEA